MQIIQKRIDIKSQSDFFYLIPIYDVHIGTRNFDEDKLDETIDFIKHNNCYWFDGGDSCDCIEYSDPRFNPEDIDTDKFNMKSLATDQYKYYIKKMMPIKSKCLGKIKGNHEDKIQQHCHIPIQDNICAGLGINNLGLNAFIRLNVYRSGKGQKNIDIFATHGFGGGRKKGGKVNNIVNLKDSYEADFYFMGHVHSYNFNWENKLYLPACLKDGKTYRFVEKSKYFGICGTYLKTYKEGTSSYGEKQCYNPELTGSLCIKIKPAHSKYNPIIKDDDTIMKVEVQKI